MRFIRLTRLRCTWRALPLAAALLLVLASCHSAAQRRREFIAQFYAEDFRPFHNVQFLERGKDEAGNLIITLFCPLADTSQHTFDVQAVLVAAPGSGALLKLTPLGSPAACAQVPDSAKLVKLVRQFVRYRVAALGAGTDGGVAVQFRATGEFGPYDLMRVADTTSLSAEFRTEFRQVRGPWYERKAAE